LSNQLLFYEQATAVSSERHRNWSVERAGYAFSRNTNSVPLTTVEFARAARVYPVVFAGAGGGKLPVAILGLKDRENLFIADDGDWTAAYIPAFVRRYPFVFATRDEGKTFTVCIDEGFAGCNQEQRGERLFDEHGERTPYLEQVLAFLQEYQLQFQRTQAFCAKLVELGLLEPMQANIALKSGTQLALTGFEVVSRERLKALSADTLKELLANDELELLFTHLASLEGFAAMIDRMSNEKGEQPEAQ